MEPVIIYERLASMNDVIEACRSHWAKGAKLKKSQTDLCKLYFKHAMQNGFKPIDYKCDLAITWYEANHKRDPDNISSGIKFILDGAVNSGALVNDSQEYIGNIYHVIEYDRHNPRVEIIFTRREDNDRDNRNESSR